MRVNSNTILSQYNIDKYHVTNYEVDSNIVEIDSNTFNGCELLKKVTIPGTVKVIGAGAFESCIRLEDIYLSEGLETLRNEVFSGCKSIKKIDLPNTIKYIGSFCFKDCSSLESIVIPESVEKLGDNLFFRCNRLTKISLPGSIRTVKSELNLRNCPVEEITLGDGIVEIERNAFYMCHELQNIHLPKTLITIGDYAFAGCSKLSSIVLPEGLQKISQFAFLDCENLSKINFPSTLNEIENNVFVNCNSLKEIELPIGLKAIGEEALSQISKIEKVVVKYENFNQLHNFVKLNQESLYRLYISKGKKIIGKRIIKFNGPKISKYESIKLALLLNVEAYDFIIDQEEKNPDKDLETIENNEKLSTYTGDEEIDDTISNIYRLITYFPKDLKNKIELQIKSLIGLYNESKEKYKPKLFDESSTYSLYAESPLAKRNNILDSLKSIEFDIKTAERYSNLLEQLAYYKDLISNKPSNVMKNDGIVDDIKNIIKISRNYSEDYYNIISHKLTVIINRIEENIYVDLEKIFDNNVFTVPSDEDYRLNLTIEIINLRKHLTESPNIVNKYIILLLLLRNNSNIRIDENDKLCCINDTRDTINKLPEGKFRDETYADFNNIIQEYENKLNSIIESDDFYSSQKYYEIVVSLLSRLTILSTRINKYYKSLSSFYGESIDINYARTITTPKVNSQLKKALLIIRGSKKYDEQELENNPVEEEIISFYMNVINNEVLLPDDKEDIKTKLLNFLEQKLLLLHQNVDGISVEELLNSIHSYISDMQKDLIKYIPEQIEYSQAFGGPKK